MDRWLSSFIERVEAFSSKAILANKGNEWDADEAARGARELKQYSTVEAVPFDFWDEYNKHFTSYLRLPDDLEHERQALLAFVEEQSRASLGRPHRTDWP